MRNSTSRIAGFTLTEILVVLGIIGLLSAIAFPVFSRVRERGRYATCTSNLKQLALAMQQYVQDNDGVYPTATYIISGSPTILWHQRLQPYVTYGSVYYCPTLKALDEPTDISNYTLNRFGLNFVPTSANAGADVGKNEAAIQFASKTFLLTEEVFLPQNESGGFGPPYPQLGAEAPSPCGQGKTYSSVVHSGGANYSFVDGHVKWLLPPAAAQVECDSRATSSNPTMD